MSAVGQDVRDTIIQAVLGDAPIDLITVKKSDSIGSTLKLLLEKEIIAVGVTDDVGDCFIGLVTAFDIMNFICLGSYKIDDVPNSIEASKSLETPIGDVTGVFQEETKRIWSFEEDMPIVQVLEPMSKGVHRAVVIMADGSFKLISQTDVVQFGIKEKDSFTDTSKTLEELGLGNPSISHVCTVTTSQSALSAFRKMQMYNHLALPVVDEKSGSIKTTISSSDVRSVSDKIAEVLKPVSEFLASIYKEVQEPLTCKRSDVLLEVMAKMVAQKHKHIWVVDDENRPISSVSLSDIINRMQGIDEDLQSRALAVYGRGAMTKLFATKVLISGLNGLGAEIAKNIILANVNSVTLHDTKETTFADLNSHFYLSEESVGQNRAQSCLSKLAELNPSVRVTASSAEVLTEEILAEHNIIVLLETSNKEAIRINEFCRSKGIKFIKTDIKGLAGFVFCDFGENFEVIDVTGEQPELGIVKEINADGRVQCVNDEILSFSEGDFVSFSEVQGMVELNDGEYVIERVTPYSFSIKGADTLNLSAYESGGIVTQVKKPKTINFHSFESGLSKCDVQDPPDFAKWDRHFILHSAFQALDSFEEKNGRAPRPANVEDCEALTALWKELNAKAEYVADEEANAIVLKQFAHGASVVINPFAAAFGGIVGQEITKAATGKFHPINQWFYLDAFEVLPEELLSAEEYLPQQCRYDAQIQLLGKSFQEKLGNLRYFLVGSGALGCEYLKNFAMTGLGCGAKGEIIVTDDDIIEKSNLSRQFLFRNWHVKKSKSLTATQSAQAMNPAIHICAKQDRVCPSTEDVFDDAFWNSLDGVCNALDNVKARLYIDQRCIFFEKSLLESGTLGPKCNSQVIVPHKTRHYGDQPDQPEKQAPVCVLHNFPHNIQHCLTWGRSEFNGNFEVAPTEVIKFAEDKEYIANMRAAQVGEGDIKEKIQVIKKVLALPCSSFEECVKWARLAYEEHFVNRVVELTHNLPKDSKTSTGAPFWSPPKRFPQSIPFDAEDPVHMQYIIAGANLKASTFGVLRPRQSRQPTFIKQILKSVEVPTFVPSSKKIKTEENEKEEEESFTVEEMEKELPAHDFIASLSMHPEDFEKDDDKNFHMDFIGAAANLRARCYYIEEVDKLKAKLIAGRIIPAIATATALATGFVMIELFKMVLDRPMGDFKTNGAFRCSSNNLALPQFSFFEPLTPVQIEDHVEKSIPDPINHPEYEEEEEIIAYPPKHTIWDKIHVTMSPDFTLQDLVDHFKTEHQLDIDGVSVSTATKAMLVYGRYSKGTHERLPTKFADLFKERTGEDLTTKSYYLPEILFSKDGDSVVNPPVVIHFK